MLHGSVEVGVIFFDGADEEGDLLGEVVLFVQVVHALSVEADTDLAIGADQEAEVLGIVHIPLGLEEGEFILAGLCSICLLYTSPSPRDKRQSRMPSSA